MTFFRVRVVSSSKAGLLNIYQMHKASSLIMQQQIWLYYWDCKLKKDFKEEKKHLHKYRSSTTNAIEP